MNPRGEREEKSRRAERPRGSDRKALAAAALALDVRVAELEGLVQALLDEIHLGAVDQLETLAVDDDLHVAFVEDDVVRVDLVRVVDQIRPAGAARALHADPEAHAAPALLEVALHPPGRALSQ